MSTPTTYPDEKQEPISGYADRLDSDGESSPSFTALIELPACSSVPCVRTGADLKPDRDRRQGRNRPGRAQPEAFET